MVRDWGIDMARRDMSYEVLRDRYFDRWLRILKGERDRSTGWVREEMTRMTAGLIQRWSNRGDAEFLEQATRQPKEANPGVALIDEAYSHMTELSRSGSSGAYNKANFDASMGQIGLYDALQSKDERAKDAGLIREALRNIAFRSWQKGGTAMVNFIGTHDGGEGNPVDKFKGVFKAAALTALMMRPTLTYNGVEQGVGQRRNIQADLKDSVDREKAIPFDVPVALRWDEFDATLQAFLKNVWKQSNRYKKLLSRGAMEVLNPKEGSPLVAWTVAGPGLKGRREVIIGVANFAEHPVTGVFAMDKPPVLASFGAFQPDPNKHYILRDRMQTRDDGMPKTYKYSGRRLLEQGLPILLQGGDVHLFEVVETDS
jgi:hypothetical protein